MTKGLEKDRMTLELWYNMLELRCVWDVKIETCHRQLHWGANASVSFRLDLDLRLDTMLTGR